MKSYWVKFLLEPKVCMELMVEALDEEEARWKAAFVLGKRYSSITASPQLRKTEEAK